MENIINITPDIERVTADFFDSEIIERTDTVYRFNTNQGRVYAEAKETEEGKKEIIYRHSVTSIIDAEYPKGYYLLKYFKDNTAERLEWVLEQSANYGTYLHYKWGLILKGQAFSFNDDIIKDEFQSFCFLNGYEYEEIQKYMTEKKRDIKKDILGFIKFAQDYNIEPIMIEFPIFGEQCAGFADLLCYMDYKDERIVALIDWKSGINDFYDPYVLQLEAYLSEFHKVYTGIKVDRLFNYGCNGFRLPPGPTSKLYRLKDQTESPLRGKWKNVLENFHMTDRTIKLRTRFKDIAVDLKTDLNQVFEEVDLLQSVLDIESKEDF